MYRRQSEDRKAEGKHSHQSPRDRCSSGTWVLPTGFPLRALFQSIHLNFCGQGEVPPFPFPGEAGFLSPLSVAWGGCFCLSCPLLYPHDPQQCPAQSSCSHLWGEGRRKCSVDMEQKRPCAASYARTSEAGLSPRGQGRKEPWGQNGGTASWQGQEAPPSHPPTTGGTGSGGCLVRTPEGSLALEPFITCSNSRNVETEGPKSRTGREVPWG